MIIISCGEIGIRGDSYHANTIFSKGERGRTSAGGRALKRFADLFAFISVVRHGAGPAITVCIRERQCFAQNGLDSEASYMHLLAHLDMSFVHSGETTRRRRVGRMSKPCSRAKQERLVWTLSLAK